MEWSWQQTPSDLMEQPPAELPSQQAVQWLLVPTKRHPAKVLLEAELRALQAGLRQRGDQEAAVTEVVRTWTNEPHVHLHAWAPHNPTVCHRTSVEEERRGRVSGVQAVAEVPQQACERRRLLQPLQQHHHAASGAA